MPRALLGAGREKIIVPRRRGLSRPAADFCSHAGPLGPRRLPTKRLGPDGLGGPGSCHCWTLSGNEAVLDLGSGDGRVTARSRISCPAGASSASTPPPDDHPRQRHHATIRQNLEFVLGDMQTVPFRNGFDRVYSSAALHWARDPSAVADGIARALRTGGRAVLQCGGAGNAAPMIAVLDNLIRSPRGRRTSPILRCATPSRRSDLPRGLVTARDSSRSTFA